MSQFTGRPWLEIVLATSVVALAIQLFPSLGTLILRGIDVRNWSRATFFLANLAVLVVLLSVRYFPGVPPVAGAEKSTHRHGHRRPVQ